MSERIKNAKIEKNVTRDKIKKFSSIEIAHKYIELYKKVLSNK